MLLESLEIPLKLGDEIIIEGTTTYMIENIKTMIYKGEKIKKISRKRHTNPVRFNLRLNKEVKPNDKVYIISNH